MTTGTAEPPLAPPPRGADAARWIATHISTHILARK